MNTDKAIAQATIPLTAIMQVQDLSFRIPERALFIDWSTVIAAGVTVVRGGESSGKTTLLRLLAGELAPDAGHLQLGDICLRDHAEAYRQQVFWTDPRTDAHDQVTPLVYFKSLQALYPRFDEQVLAELIEGLSLGPHLGKQLFMLSTGSKRKVWLAAAFASGAAVTLLDEPFVALDGASIRFVKERLKKAADEPVRACVMTGYEAPAEVPLAAIIDLGD